jgi:hypothetical protein
MWRAAKGGTIATEVLVIRDLSAPRRGGGAFVGRFGFRSLKDTIYDPLDLKIEKNFDRPFAKFTDLLFLPPSRAPYKLCVAATLPAREHRPPTANSL